jgi:hypothetical protein
MKQRTKTGFPQHADFDDQGIARRHEFAADLAIGRQRFHRTDSCHRNGLQRGISLLRRGRTEIGSAVIRLTVLLDTTSTRTATTSTAGASSTRVTRFTPTAASGRHGQRKNSNEGQKQLSHNAVLCGTKWHSLFQMSGCQSWVPHKPLRELWSPKSFNVTV